MPQKKNFFPVFLGLFIFTALLFLLSLFGILNGVTGFFEQATLPLQQATFNLFHPNNITESERLRIENSKLNAQLVDKMDQVHENQALRDQFATTYPKPKSLLPARIVGVMGDEIIIDKGEKDSVKQGFVAVVDNNLIGIIVKTTSEASVLDVITRGTNLTAKTLKTSSPGIVNTQGGNLILNNVDLSEKLEKDDFVMTKGDVGENGKGVPPDLVIGKIVSINKKASSVFQTAAVKSLVDFSRLEIVFVMIK